MSKVISILTPTRQRPARLAQFIMSVYQHTSNKERVEMLIYVDNDDPAREQYMDFFEHCQTEFQNFLRIHFLFDEPKSVSKSWNDLYERSVGDIIIMGNDDLMYRTPQWDVRVEQAVEQYPDEIYCMWMEDGINSGAHCAFPIVSRKWCETLGYFTPGVFHFGYNDTWVYDIAMRVDRTQFLNNIIGEHLHFTQGKSQRDETYNRNRVEGRNYYQLDGVIFNSPEMIAKRDLDAHKLLEVINDFSNL